MGAETQDLLLFEAEKKYRLDLKELTPEGLNISNADFVSWNDGELRTAVSKAFKETQLEDKVTIQMGCACALIKPISI